MISKEACEKRVIELIRNIYDPEIPVNIYDLGLIYMIIISEFEDGYACYIEMTLTSPGCPVAESLMEQVYNVSFFLEEVKEMKVDLVFEPPWDPKTMMSYEAQLELGIL